MDPSIALKVFEFIVLLFALSCHEAAHAWTASRLGDPTARMLGRVTLNPAKHIDPFGTLLLPLITLFVPGFGGILFGWAKPTPVTGRNFRHYKRDDTLVTLAGPASNLLLAILSLVVLLLIEHFVPVGRACVTAVASGGLSDQLMSAAPVVLPIVMIFFFGITLNLVLAVFNLMPFPPLDGSHLVRHMLSGKLASMYDTMGYFGFFLAILIGGRLTWFIVAPMLRFFEVLLLRS